MRIDAREVDTLPPRSIIKGVSEGNLYYLMKTYDRQEHSFNVIVSNNGGASWSRWATNRSYPRTHWIDGVPPDIHLINSDKEKRQAKLALRERNSFVYDVREEPRAELYGGMITTNTIFDEVELTHDFNAFQRAFEAAPLVANEVEEAEVRRDTAFNTRVPDTYWTRGVTLNVTGATGTETLRGLTVDNVAYVHDDDTETVTL